MTTQLASCPFCELVPGRILTANDLGVAFRDAFPISPGHTLVIPRRHTGSLFNLDEAERLALLALVDASKQGIDAEFHPDGYNIGINDGPAAGQTVMHLHIHLVPRYKGDRQDPRGGVRWIFPEKAKYWP